MLHLVGPQAGSFFAAVGHIAVTLGAMLFEKLAASHNGVGILRERIAAGDSFFRSFRELRVNILSEMTGVGGLSDRSVRRMQ